MAPLIMALAGQSATRLLLRTLTMQMLEGGSRRYSISRKVRIGYLGDAEPVETRREAGEANLVAAQQHPVG